LKEIARAYRKAEQKPPAGFADEHGKPLLSWRVGLLPYLGLGDLFNRFKIDEPWDGPNNRKLLAEMPEIYQPVRGSAPRGHTYYQGFTGPQAVFPAEGLIRGRTATGEVNCPMFINFGRITDGRANTLMIVEGAKAVPWTKPNDLPYDPVKPVPKLGGQFEGDFNACFCNGSVYLMPRTLPEKVLRALITPAGGEVVDLIQLGLADPVRNAGADARPRDEKGTVTGTVTYKGVPLPAGAVALHFTDDTKYVAAVGPEGSFRLTDLPVGSFRVAVSTTPGKDKPFVKIPNKYHSPQTSALSVVVKGGEQSLRIDLKD
jgi:hypothetical protein